MNQRIILLCGAILLLILIIGCTELDPVHLAKENEQVKEFLTQHENAKLKSNFYDSTEINAFEKEITKNCGTTINQGYRISFADFDAKKGITTWIDKDARKVLCVYKLDLSAGEKIVCLSGTFNKDTNTCEKKPLTTYTCNQGTYNENTNQCEYTPPTQTNCTTGTFNSDTNQCEYNPTLQYNCEQGTYNPNTNQCEITPTTQIICEQGIYEESTNTCEYIPPTEYVCEQGTYDETTQTCIYNPPTETPTHTECSNNTCIEVNGTGTNTCSTNTDCETPPIENFEDSPFGWNSAQPYEYASDLGTKWSRGVTTIFWWIIQPDANKREYTFSRDYFDAKKNIIINADAGMRARLNTDENMNAIEVIAITLPLPDARNIENSYEPVNKEEYINFVKTVVERYDGDNDYGCVVPAPDCYVVGDTEYPSAKTISAIMKKPLKNWQITNEPMYESPKEIKLAGLAELTRLTYLGLKQADPSATLILGSFNGESIASYDDKYEPFLRELSQLNGKYFDVLDIHWYGGAFGEYRLIDKKTETSLIDHIKLSLENLFPYEIPIWMCETGTHSGSIDDYPQLKTQSEQQQAGDYVKRYLYGGFKGVEKMFGVLGFVEGTWTAPNNYFSKTELIYDGTGNDDLGANVKKLSYYSYKLMVEKLEGSDWGNIDEVPNSIDNVYTYKFIKNNEPIYVVWWDYWNEPSSTQKIITLSDLEISGTHKITEAVPHFENGLILQNSGETYPNFFDKTTTSSTITLGQTPIYIE